MKDDGPAVAGAEVPPAPEFAHTDDEGRALPVADEQRDVADPDVVVEVAPPTVEAPHAESADITPTIARADRNSVRICGGIVTRHRPSGQGAGASRPGWFFLASLSS
ncbi:MAG: hypothetical protein ACREN2_06970 [Candidatus Dormibacteria bacterium]